MKDQKFKPTAFMSYVRSDDSDKRISKLRELLTEAVRRNTGFETFEIFQDVIHIRWGEDWEDKLKKSINEVIFFIPILTPRFFKSKYCICELRAFLDREKELNRKDLTLPIYYRNDPKFDSNTREDELAFKLKKRAFIDWRDLKNVPIEAQNFSSRDEYSKVQERLDSLAIQIREALERVENEGELAENNDSNIKALYSSNNKKLLEQYLGKDYISQCERHNGNTIIKNNITLGQLKTIYENIFQLKRHYCRKT